MVYETVLTILFAVGIGVAIIAYAAKPRQRGGSISVASAIPASAESFAPAQAVESVQVPQETAVETPVVESSTRADSEAIAETAPAVAVSATGASEVTLASASTADLSAVGPISEAGIAGSPAQIVPKARRTQRRKSTSTKAHARPSSRTTRKR